MLITIILYLNILNYHHSYLLSSVFAYPSSAGFYSIGSTDTFFTVVVYEEFDSEVESLFYYDPDSVEGFDSSLLPSASVAVLAYP
jgi:hypothetical protein